MVTVVATAGSTNVSNCAGRLRSTVPRGSGVPAWPTPFQSLNVGADLLLDQRRIGIADEHQGGIFGPVIAMVKAAHRIGEAVLSTVSVPIGRRLG